MKEAFNVFVDNHGIIISFDVLNKPTRWAGIILMSR